MKAGRKKESSEVPLSGLPALDRSSSVPLYFQLAAALKGMLETGGWRPGARFATERELEERFQVSQVVVRKALDLLVGDGAIIRVKGSGAFVAPPRREIEVLGLIRTLLEPPEDLTVTVLTAREELPDAPVAQLLEMKRGPTSVVHVTGVLRIEGSPVGLIDSHSVITAVPWMLPTAQALRAGTCAPKSDGLELGQSKVSIEHTFFGAWGGSKLEVSAGDPALMGRLVQYGKARGARRERPIELARLVYRTDRAQLAFVLG